MLRYPKLNEIPASRSMMAEFKGYNHNPRIGKGEFYDMLNLTSDEYPLLAPRKKRGTYKTTLTSFGGMLSKDELCCVEGENFCVGDSKIALGLSNGEKQLVSMGAYAVIMPDQKYVNTKDLSDYGRIANTWEYGKINTTYPPSVTAVMVNEKGEDVTFYNQATEPTKEANVVWHNIDTGKFYSSKFKFDGTYSWVEETPYFLFNYEDGEMPETGRFIDVTTKKDDHYENILKGTFKVIASGTFIVGTKQEEDGTTSDVTRTGFIIQVPIPSQTANWISTITLNYSMPIMDYVIEAGNRLWGCRYGTNLNGDLVNEIYASALGDFAEWGEFRGVSTDPWVASVGTDGAFTGAINYGGYPIFFKENNIHRVFGNYPSNFQIQTTTGMGVQSGSHKSLAIVNNIIYYKGKTGVFAYDGAMPVEISEALGDETYSNAVAGALKSKYYISMKNEEAEHTLFVFDTNKKMWHKEDSTEAVQFCSHGGDLFYIDRADNCIKSVRGQGVTETEVKWEATTGILGANLPDSKYVSRLDVRLSLDYKTRVSLYIQYNSSGEWVHLHTIDGTKLQSTTIPIKPIRCDHYQLKLLGKGDAKIFSITETIEEGEE